MASTNTGGAGSESVYAWDVPTIDEIRASVLTLKEAAEAAKTAYDVAREQVKAGYTDDFGAADSLMNTMEKDSKAMELLAADLDTFANTLNEVAELYSDGEKTITEACESTLSEVEQELQKIS